MVITAVEIAAPEGPNSLTNSRVAIEDAPILTMLLPMSMVVRVRS